MRKASGKKAAQPRAADTVAEPALPRQRASFRPMNLKGKDTSTAIGKCVRVLYDEGGTALVPYIGVVVFVEKHRCASSRSPSRPARDRPRPCRPRHATLGATAGRGLLCCTHLARACALQGVRDV